jgi:hypothetical protein
MGNQSEGCAVASVTRDRKRKNQGDYRARMRALGLVEFHAWIPAWVVPDLTEQADRLRADRDLTVGPLRHGSNGRLVALRRRP